MQAITCPHCNKETGTITGFCERCGLRLPSDLGSRPEARPERSAWLRSYRGYLVIAVIALTLVLVFTSIVLFFRSLAASSAAGNGQEDRSAVPTNLAETTTILTPATPTVLSTLTPTVFIATMTPSPSLTHAVHNLSSTSSTATSPTNTAIPLPTDTATKPPTLSPTPLGLRFKVRVDVSYPGSGNAQTYKSCVAGHVSGIKKVYAGVTVNVNNGPDNSYTTLTGEDGVYRVCGLGASNWSVVIKKVPGQRLSKEPVGVVYVNGGDQEAIVNFSTQ